jgi:hypothetical protein
MERLRELFDIEARCDSVAWCERVVEHSLGVRERMPRPRYE